MNTKSLREIEKYKDVPGSTFVGWRLAGLPVFKLQVGVLAIQPKPIEPIDEFLIRTLNLGIQEFSDVQNFLGLDAATVQNHLADLHRSDLIKVSQADSESKIELTPKGKSVAVELKANQIVELTIPVLFDGICRKPLEFDLDLLNDIQVNELDAITIPPYPARRPSIDQLKLEQLKPLTHRYWRKKLKEEEVPEIIGIKRIATERFGMFYRLATMLVNQNAANSATRNFSFVVEGFKDDEIGDYFDKKDMQKNLPVRLELNPVSVEQTVQKYIPDYLDFEMSEVLAAAEISGRIEENLGKTQEMRDEVVAEQDTNTKQRQAAEIDRLESENGQLRERLDKENIIPLFTTGIIKVLDHAIKTAQERLVIVSGTISDHAIGTIEPELEKLVERGVELWLGYGMGGNDRQSKSQRSKASFNPAVERLKRIQKLNPDKVKLLDLGKNHMKVLVCDDKYVVVGSLNFLSYRPWGKTVMAENAIQILDKAPIEKYRKDCEKMFGQVGSKN